MEYPPQSTKESKMSVCACVLSHFSCVRLSATPWTMARQAPLSMGFSRQEYLSGPPFPSPVIKYEVSEVKSLSCVWLFATPGTVAYQAPHPWDFPGKSSGVGCHLRNKWQGSPALTFSFLTNPTSLHYTWLLYTRLQGRKFCRSVKKDFFQDSCGSPPPSRHWPLGLPFSGVVLATGCPREVLELRVTPQGALLPGARSAWHGFPASLH